MRKKAMFSEHRTNNIVKILFNLCIRLSIIRHRLHNTYKSTQNKKLWYFANSFSKKQTAIKYES